jgi:hypothetical protein
MGSFEIVVRPDSQVIWESWGKNHFNFTTLICEFIDNSISSFLANPNIPNKTVLIKLKLSEDEKTVEVSVEDNGAGIKNFSGAFSPGDKNRSTDSFLNEHGFGLKNALATANPENNTWTVLSRAKKDLDDGIINIVKAPWKMTFDENKFSGESKKAHWPGVFNSSGTIVMFSCPKALFDSVSPRSSRFDHNCEYLLEELSVIYRPFLRDVATIRLVSEGHQKVKEMECEAIFPNNPWNKEDSYIKHNMLERIFFSNPGKFKVNSDKVEVEYEFYAYTNKEECSKRKKYYKHNVSSQGVEIRSNGRLISYPVFEEIWGVKQDNYYNSFWGVINIKGEAKYLPSTSTTKTGFVPSDPVYKEVLEKTSEIFKTSFIVNERKIKKGQSEKEKTEEWLKNLTKWEKIKVFDSEVSLFEELDLKNERIGSLDALLYDKNDNVVLVENKKEKSKLLDFYQLVMYWDGYVFDKKKSPDKAILLANEHPVWSEAVLKEINSKKDSLGNNYCFETKRWSDYDV